MNFAVHNEVKKGQRVNLKAENRLRLDPNDKENHVYVM